MNLTHVRMVVVCVFTAAFFSGCATSSHQTGSNATPDGFKSLFDGKSLNGWRPLVASPPDVEKMDVSEYAEQLKQAYERMKLHWRAEDGEIITDGHGQNLCTTKNYRNFELRVDWMIEKGGDSGIYLRGAPQVQIWDIPDVGSGGLYNNQKNASKPLVIADNPPGEWNTFRITMVDDRVTVYLNNALVVDNTIMENYWDRSQPIYRTGPIELQAHGNTVRFRNIFINELP